MNEYMLTDKVGNCVDPALTDVERDLFFDESAAVREDMAKVFCTDCPIWDTCLRLGLDTAAKNGAAYGVWGGVQPEQITYVLRKRVIDVKCVKCGVKSGLRVQMSAGSGRWPEKGRVICDACGFWFDNTTAARNVQRARP